MDPALAARIQARIRGRRAEPGRALAPLAVSALRFAALALVVAFVVVFLLARHRARQELAAMRAALLERASSARASLTDDDLKTPARVEAWLARAASAYPGDHVAEALRAPGGLAATLERPAIYVRGDLDTFTSPAASRASAAQGRKDAFLLCLLEPPEGRSEKAQLKQVLAAYAGGARVEAPTAHVRLLSEAQLGLPLLTPEWQEQVRRADSYAEFEQLRRDFERAPIAAARQAAKARLVVFALDERGDGRGVTELDGERPHPVRVGIVDLASDRVLLRARRNVDPKWISAARRAEYARGLDDCALALDVRDSVIQPRAEAP